MPLGNHANHIGLPIHDQRKQTHDVAPEDARVQRFEPSESGVIAAENSSSSVIAGKPDLCRNGNRIRDSTDASEAMIGSRCGVGKSQQDIRTENGLVRSRVYQKRDGLP